MKPSMATNLGQKITYSVQNFICTYSRYMLTIDAVKP